MNLYINQLIVNCNKAREVLPFARFNYYYGQMGAGKSTIARLIDFCLGGKLDYTPALQQEFVSATLDLVVARNKLLLSRRSGENQIEAQWTEKDQPYDVLLPGRVAAGEVLPGTGVEVLSDLLFHLAGIKPPRVRKSKINEDSDLVRLSFRDLFWYCYLDQDSMDSSFFNLDDGNPSIRQKSRDVLRFMIGFHQEKVSDLEAELDQSREDRLRCETAAAAIKEALEAEQLATPEEIFALREKLKAEIQQMDALIANARAQTGELRTHQTETLQMRGRELAARLAELDSALEDLRETVAKDKSHRNTLLSLATRQKRAQSARAVLTGVEFAQCPQCYQMLPERENGLCRVCGHQQGQLPASPLDEESIEADAKARAEELAERIKLQTVESKRLQRERQVLVGEKSIVDQDLTQASQTYDSAYLAEALELEKNRARLVQRAADLRQMETLANKVDQLQHEAARLAGREAELRAELRTARAEAERDRSNIDLLEKLFLNCLLRSRLPGILDDDWVELTSPHFLPNVHGRNTGDMVYTSFANLGSGGKKSFFKCCFAVAVHRLAARIGALLPTVLIIDSPMKNISERENPEQFSGFHEMLHELADTELKGTQIIVIDKEIFRPKTKHEFEFQERHMKPDDDENPPLIKYYRGK